MLKVVGASWNQTKIITAVLGSMVGLGIIVYIFGENERLVENGIYSATVYYSAASGFHVTYWGEGQNLEEIPTGVAKAHYKTDIANSGWAFFEAETNPDSLDWHQAFAAGALEGSLSWQSIYWHWYNTVRYECKSREKFCYDVRTFLQENWKWTVQTAAEQQEMDPFWHQVYLFSMQLKGIEHGFKCGVERSRNEFEIPSVDFIWMNAMPDLAELEQKFNGSLANGFNYSKIYSFSSAFVKLLPESRRLIIAHNTGGTFQSMQRILKKYKFHYHLTSAHNSPEVPGQIISFSSYPGVVSSQDDFYSISGSKDSVIKHQFVVAGTAIKNYNAKLWDNINATGTVLLGPRVMSANRLATSGHNWGIILVRNNSGTGNKQWLIADFAHPFFKRTKRHKKNYSRRKPKGLLWVWEQYPGFFKFSDQTHQLHKTTYWAAFNGLPFHKELITRGHLNFIEKENIELFPDNRSPISNLFEKNHSFATDASTAFQLMRNNWYSVDSLGKESFVTLAPRADVNEDNPFPAGVIDTKVIDGNDSELKFEAISGPSLSYSFNDYSDDDEENDVVNYMSKPQPFQWSLSKFSNTFHFGQPDLWHFSEINVEWFSPSDNLENE